MRFYDIWDKDFNHIEEGIESGGKKYVMMKKDEKGKLIETHGFEEYFKPLIGHYNNKE